MNPSRKHGMRRFRWYEILALLVGLGGLVLLVFSCARPDAELIPREILFGNPVKHNPEISPDGTMLAYVAPLEGVVNLWVKTIGKDDDRPVTEDRDRGIRYYIWAGDSEHLLYIQDAEGDENWRLYGVNVETDDIRDYTPYEDVQVRLVDWSKHFPTEVLISMNKDDPKVHDVYHLDLTTGELKLIAKNPGNIMRWVADADFNVRCALAATPDGGYNCLVRETEASPWETLVSWDSENTLNSGPFKFTRDGRSLYMVDSRNVNAGRLVKMEIASGEIEVIAEDSRYDVSDAIIHPDTYEIQAVAFTRARSEWVVLDDAIRDDMANVFGLARGDLYRFKRDNDDDTWLVGFTSDDAPVSYYMYDRNTGEGTFLFYTRPDLTEYKLAQMKPVSFEASDGLTIHGYLTLPPGRGDKYIPMVLRVHGGPWHRDSWGFDNEVQWFANRGYACLQVNFRGSTGYGKDFVNAGDKEWGGKMHQDLVDGVHWAVDQGIADPERVAIYGGSFGGYAALVGATFTPDLFCCAVDIVGASNLVSFIKSAPPYWSTYLAIMHKRVGNPDTEADFLKSRSPLFKVDQIKIPILIAQGANDVRVKQSESEQIVAAMREKGLDYEYMLFEDEGHGFTKPENRLEFYAAAEKFLAKHLDGRHEE